MNNIYMFWDGLTRLAQEVTGQEKIHVGIRPFELHAGNVASIVGYPLLLCERTQRNGREARFTLYVSINDWEQDRVVGPDVFKYSIDIRAEHTNIGHLRHRSGVSMVDFWQNRIEEELNIIRERFPHVRIIVVRNSSLKSTSAMKKVIEDTLEHSQDHKELMARVANLPTTDAKAAYCNIICPKCSHANTKSALNQQRDINYSCELCGASGTLKYDAADFWLFHKQLWEARLAHWNFDIAISGGDHLDEGDVAIRRALYEFIFKQPMPKVRMLFAPLLIARDGNKMSKYRKNDEYIPAERVVEWLRGVSGSSINPNWDKATNKP